jgi:hypothetical protein
MTMSRIEPKNRMSNATFSTALKHKLRLPIILNHQEYKCHCGKWVDAYGDHCLGCCPNGRLLPAMASVMASFPSSNAFFPSPS